MTGAMPDARTRPKGLTLAARFCDTEFYLIKLSGSNMVNISQITWSEHKLGKIGTWSQNSTVTLRFFALPYGSHWLSLTAWLLALHVVSCRFQPFRIFVVTCIGAACGCGVGVGGHSI